MQEGVDRNNVFFKRMILANKENDALEQNYSFCIYTKLVPIQEK
jgi:hypothetical protein